MAHEVLLQKLQEHSNLSRADTSAISSLPDTQRQLEPGQDIVVQGDKPNVSVVVLSGMVARYQTLKSGRRQYLSFHLAGDMPDAQTLFIDVIEYSVCAMDRSAVAMVPHAALISLFRERPSVAFAIWRETLIDAAMFREVITNNSGRPMPTRLAHFLCEQYYRARAGHHARPGSCRLPLTQTQIGEALGASLPSVARALHTLRRTGAMELRGGRLQVHDWSKMVELGDFNPSYLHLRKPARL